ncbi:hypothetical protein ABZP36_027501 [Zizania latifolia]
MFTSLDWLSCTCTLQELSAFPSGMLLTAGLNDAFLANNQRAYYLQTLLQEKWTAIWPLVPSAATRICFTWMVLAVATSSSPVESGRREKDLIVVWWQAVATPAVVRR